MTATELKVEVSDLRAHLEEAQEALHAIRVGQADAVVVSRAQREKVFVLKNAERPYRIFLETMNQGAVTLLQDGTIAYSNRRFAEILKTPLEKVTGGSLDGFIAPDQRHCLRHLLEKVRSGDVREVLPFGADTARVRLELSLCPTELEMAPGICVIATDMTQRREDHELRFLLSAIVDSSDDSIIGKALNGVIQSCNRGAEKLHGFAASEMIGRPISMLEPPDHADETTRVLDRIRHGERVDHYETERLKKDWTLVPVTVSISPILDSDGDVTGASSIARDISARKPTEAELRRVSAYQRSLIEASLDPLVTIPPEGSITDVNRATEMITGRDRHELIRSNFCGYFQDPEKECEAYRRAFREGLVEGCELELIGPEVTSVLYDASSYRDEQGNVVCLFAAARVITERKRAEVQIKELNATLERRIVERTGELLAANKELESFSYSVSHDLRAPLRSLDGFCQVLMEDYADKVDDQGKDYLQRVRAASQRMDHLIEGMLILSRIGRSEMRRTNVDISAMAQTIALDLQKVNSGRQVEFVIAPGLTASADSSLLRTALQNLLENAWKFTSKHPEAWIEVGTLQHAGERAFFGRDNGAAFEMAYVGKLSGVFQRLHTPAEFEGTGIGLASVQRIIHRHGGKGWAEGEPEKGAAIFFTLPQQPEVSQ